MIVERLIPDDRAPALPALLSDMNVLVFTGGKERTKVEYGKLLPEAGLNPGWVLPLAPAYRVIEGSPVTSTEFCRERGRPVVREARPRCGGGNRHRIIREGMPAIL
jgi:O-methyltransferase domain